MHQFGVKVVPSLSPSSSPSQMDKQQLNSWLGHGGDFFGEEQLDFSGFPLWNWQPDYPIVDQSLIEATSLMESNSLNSLFPSHDLFQDELYSMFDGGIGFWDEVRDGTEPKETASCDDLEKRVDIKREKKVEKSGEEKNMTFEEVSRYFYMPITQAAKELNVGLTFLKKKCRELGIPRWPHRKMKSLQTLIRNVQELGREEGDVGEAQLRTAIEILEQEKQMMEKEPALQLEEKTKKLRQACFKVNYKKRRLMAIEEGQATPIPGYLCGEGREYLC